MNEIMYKNAELFVGNTAVREIAQSHRTPFWVYSKAEILANIAVWSQEVNKKNLVCFALKANDNKNIVNLMGGEGLGADVVSAGELFLALKAGIAPDKIVFAGVGKQDFEIEYALRQKIRAFNVESEQELQVIQDIAERMNVPAPIHIRVNPDIDAKSHPYITTGMAKNKFGIETGRAIDLFKYAKSLSNISLKGIHVHIGSQLLDMSPFEDCSKALRELYFTLKNLGIEIDTIDLGGGLGVDYRQVIDWPPDETGESFQAPSVEDYTSAILKHLIDLPLQFVFEPGRSMIANTAILVVSVIYTKKTSEKKFIIVNGGMNDLIRPSLYQAYHRILPLKNPVRETRETVDVVGPICETTDFLAKDRLLPKVERGELLAIFSSGAYGYSLSSNYNGRGRLAEILVDGSKYKVIRRAETYEDFLKLYE
ncbi:MAG TPA: diaminopimelate decarboxylase [Bacteroidetes bacterium]|nr:diaminopimelate decarboxylase [Bacteroidota bacterium]